MMKNLLKIKEAIIVEGTYDKIKLSSVVDALIIQTNGFQVFRDKDTLELIRSAAQKTGIIVLTDSDSAGFIIRNYVKQGIDKANIKHAYIPDIFGKEKRKTAPSKEGKLGVEGIEVKMIAEALINAGATVIDECGAEVPKGENARLVTKLDLYNDGFTGVADSFERRRKLQKMLSLPERMSANMLVDAINAIVGYDEYKKAADAVNGKTT